jgi:hypothetical protein
MCEVREKINLSPSIAPRMCMVACSGRSTHSLFGTRSVVSCTPQVESPCEYFIGGQIIPRRGQDAMANRFIDSVGIIIYSAVAIYVRHAFLKTLLGLKHVRHFLGELHYFRLCA